MQSENRYFSVPLTRSQRRAIAELLPQLADRLKLDVEGQRKIDFRVGELQSILWCAGDALVTTGSGMKRNSLRYMIEAFKQAIRAAHEITSIPPAKRLYQFKITLQGIEPTIWRRIQIRDCTVDKLHEHIQTAMGWTNSHLHRFEIQGIVHGDPELLCDHPDPDCFVGVNSRKTKISEIVPQSGARLRFAYVYDFGDNWKHEVWFEGCLEQTDGIRYPLCVEGARACPPEDVGGVWGYQEFLRAIADPSHEEHLEWRHWAGDEFDAERFDHEHATRRMRQGLPDWRRFAVES